MNRIDRLSAILIQLQSRKIVRAADIALRFDISLRTVYRDIRSLEEAGIPIIGEAGLGYSLMDGYRLPPVMFSREEATAFITAEKLVSTLTDSINSNSYSSALYKIKAVLRNSDKDYLESLEERIHVVKANRPLPYQVNLNPLQLILKGIAEKLVLKLDYFSYYRQEQTSRCIEPIGVFYMDNYWHLIAWCRERKACRDFRFDRITGIDLCEETFEDVHLNMKDYIKDFYKEMKLHEVTIHVKQRAYLNLGEQKYYHGYHAKEERDGGYDLHFLTMSIEGFARWFLSFADYAHVVKPAELNTRVKEIYFAIGQSLLT